MWMKWHTRRIPLHSRWQCSLPCPYKSTLNLQRDLLTSLGSNGCQIEFCVLDWFLSCRLNQITERICRGWSQQYVVEGPATRKPSSYSWQQQSSAMSTTAESVGKQRSSILYWKVWNCISGCRWQGISNGFNKWRCEYVNENDTIWSIFCTSSAL